MDKLEPKDLIKFIDYTILSSKQSIDDTLKFISTVKQLNIKPAAICTYSAFMDTLINNKIEDVRSCVVSSSFPTGNSTMESDLLDFGFLNSTYIDEVDIVLPYHLVQSFNDAKEFLNASRKALKDKTLKVIIESGQLSDQEIIQASKACVEAKVDFIKTSTGKTDNGATVHAVKLISEVIKDHFNSTNEKVGIKVSGGIRTYEEAIEYVDVIQNMLSSDWLHPTLFRIGASSLINNLIH